MSKVLHANWSEGVLHLWAEDTQRFGSVGAGSGDASPVHAFATNDLAAPWLPKGPTGTLKLRLPSIGGLPLASATLLRSLGRGAPEEGDGHGVVELKTFEVPTLALAPDQAAPVLLGATEALAEQSELGSELGEAGEPVQISAGSSLIYFAQAARLVKHLLAQQRFVPALVQTGAGELEGQWEPWVSDEATASRVTALVSAMPASARAAADRFRHEPWPVTEDFLAAVTDAECRRQLLAENFAEAVEDKPATDPHVAWLAGLLGTQNHIGATQVLKQDLARRVRSWLGVLEERGASSAWRLLFRLAEPIISALPGDQTPDPEEPVWNLSFHLQSVEQPGLVLDAGDVWLLTGDSVTVMGRRLEQPQELLLGELGRASRFYPRLEEALEDNEPEELMLGTRKSYEFLREVRPVLLEQGFSVEAPAWWDSPTARLGAKLRLESDDGIDPFALPAGGLTNAARAQLGLASLINYKWEIAVGDTTLSLHEFEQLAAKRTPLVRINGRWVEIRPEDVHAAIKFIRDNPGGRIKLGEAMRLAYGSDLRQTGIPVVGMEATGWLNAFLNSESSSKQLEQLAPPKGFHGTLRPYQARGVSWMAFQETLGFGVCLADDMGLGKTIQLLALMAHERELGAQVNAELGTRNAELGTIESGTWRRGGFRSAFRLPSFRLRSSLPRSSWSPCPLWATGSTRRGDSARTCVCWCTMAWVASRAIRSWRASPTPTLSSLRMPSPTATASSWARSSGGASCWMRPSTSRTLPPSRARRHAALKRPTASPSPAHLLRTV